MRRQCATSAADNACLIVAEAQLPAVELRRQPLADLGLADSTALSHGPITVRGSAGRDRGRRRTSGLYPLAPPGLASARADFIRRPARVPPALRHAAMQETPQADRPTAECGSPVRSVGPGYLPERGRAVGRSRTAASSGPRRDRFKSVP